MATASKNALEDKVSATMDQVEGVASTDDIPTLIAEHRAALDELRVLVAEYIPKSGWDGLYLKYDDIFFLRYILSFSTAENAKAAVIATFEYREKPETKEMIRKVMDDTLKDSPIFREMEKYQVAGLLPREAQLTQGPTVVIRGGMGDPEALIMNVPMEEMQKAQLAMREAGFYFADVATRNTGKLAKQALLFDMTGAKLSNMMDRRMSNVYAKVGALSAMYYPQLLSKMCMCNSPSWMAWVVSFFKTILPKRNTDKIEVFSTPEELWGSEWASATLQQEFVPDFLGGGMAEIIPELTGELLAPEGEDGGWQEVVVPRRSGLDVSLDVPMGGLVVKYDLSVAAYGVNVTGQLVEADGTVTVLLDTSKAKAEDGLFTGSLLVPRPGALQLHLDNSYSMVRSKTVQWRLALQDVAPEALAAPAEGEAKAPSSSLGAILKGDASAVTASMVQINM